MSKAMKRNAIFYRITMWIIAGMLVGPSSVMAGAEPALAVTNDLKLWLKANAGVVTDGSGRVATWTDQATNFIAGDTAQNFAQTVQASKPYLASSGGPNQKPCLQFDYDGGTNALDGPNFMSFPSFTMFAVAKGTNSANAGYIFLDYGGDTWPVCVMSVTTARQFQAYVRGPSPGYDILAKSASGLSTNWSIVAARLDAPAKVLSLYVNQSLAQSSTNVNYDSTTKWDDSEVPRLGAYWSGAGPYIYRLQGGIAEFLIYTNALSDASRQSVENYLYNKHFVRPPRGTIITTY